MNYLSRFKFQIFLVGLILQLQGCVTVVTDQPIGNTPYEVSPDAWNGAWEDVQSGEIIHIQVIDSKKGLIQIADVHFKEKKFELISFSCQILKAEVPDRNDGYINCYDEEIKSYYFVMTQLEDDESKKQSVLLLWFPNIREFTKVVRLGILNGKETTDEIRLLDSPKKIQDLIELNGSKYFDWTRPMVIKKLN